MTLQEIDQRLVAMGLKLAQREEIIAMVRLFSIEHLEVNWEMSAHEIAKRRRKAASDLSRIRRVQ